MLYVIIPQFEKEGREEGREEGRKEERKKERKKEKTAFNFFTL